MWPKSTHTKIIKEANDRLINGTCQNTPEGWREAILISQKMNLPPNKMQMFENGLPERIWRRMVHGMARRKNGLRTNPFESSKPEITNVIKHPLKPILEKPGIDVQRILLIEKLLMKLDDRLTQVENYLTSPEGIAAVLAAHATPPAEPAPATPVADVPETSALAATVASHIDPTKDLSHVPVPNRHSEKPHRNTPISKKRPKVVIVGMTHVQQHHIQSSVDTLQLNLELVFVDFDKKPHAISGDHAIIHKIADRSHWQQELRRTITPANVHCTQKGSAGAVISRLKEIARVA